MNQEKLGECLGLTFQQVQKYERGANRVGASRLFDLSRVLDVRVGYFFEEISANAQAASPVEMPLRYRIGSGDVPVNVEIGGQALLTLSL